MKYLLIITVLFGFLFATRNVDATSNIPYPRAENVSQTVVTREPSSGGSGYLCHDVVVIVDKELPHGEQINAYPKTICK